MDNFVLKVQAQLDTSQLSNALNGFKGKLKVDVDTSNITKKIQDAINAASKQKVKLPDVSGGSGGKAKTSGNTNEYIKQLQKIEAMTNKINTKSFDASLAKLNAQQSKYFNNDSAQYKAASTAVKQYETALKEARLAQEKFKASGSKLDGEALAKSYDKVTNSLKLAQSEMQILATSQEKVVDSFSKASAMNSFNQYLTKNSKAVKAYSTEIDDLKTKLKSVETTGQLKSVQGEIKALQTRAAMEGNIGRSVFDDFKNNISKFSSWLGIGNLVAGGIRGVKDMATAVKDVNAATIELTKVSNAPASDIKAYFSEAATSAKDLGASISDVISSTADFSRLGYNLKDSSELAKTATLYTNVGDNIDIGTASSAIISTIKGFDLAAKDSEQIIDKFNEVGNNFAIGSDGLGEALRRSASSLSASGNTLDQSIGLITAANTVVQDPDSVGTAFKTLSMRIRGAETELEEAGLDTDGMTESTAKLREEILALSGVDIMKDKDTFKSTYDILDQLANKWQDLTDIQQASITELIAGKRQGNIMSALMSNFDIARNATETSINSEGSALKEQENYEKGIQYSLDRMKASFQEFANTTISSDIFKGLVDGANSLLETVTKIAGLGNGSGLLGILGLGVGGAAVAKNFD